MLLTLLAFVSLLGYQGCLATLDIEATTVFINKQVEVVLGPLYSYIFTAPTCGHYDKGYSVTVEIYNPNNPTNNPDFGITYFALTNKQTNGTIQPADIICSIDEKSTYSNTCNGPTGKGDVYVYVQGNNKYGINFAVNVTFARQNPERAKKPREAPRAFRLPTVGGTIIKEELRQVVTYGSTIDLAYGNRTHIHLKVCPSALTTEKFTVTSILQADDGDAKSLIAQAICKTSACSFDTPDRVGDNTHDLPVNEAVAKADSYTDLYVYAVAYNGVLRNNWPHGMFRFGATVAPSH